MECAVVIVENGCIVIYKSDDRLKLEKEVMDSAGIGRADLIEHIEHEKIERNEHHGE